MKKIVYILMFLFLIILSSCDSKKYKLIEHLEYQEYQDIKYGRHKRNKLDLNLPANTTNPGLILFIHGGSWVSGDKEAYTNKMKEWTLKGYATCSINYRFISGKFDYSDMLDDITNALKKVKELSSSIDITINKVLLTGHSAGGHLSLLYAYSRIDEAPIKPTCVINESGPTDLTDDNYYIGNQFSIKLVYLFSNLVKEIVTTNNYKERQNLLLKASPINYINKDTVPTITCHGMLDDVVPYSNALKLHEKLSTYNIYNILIPFPNSGHNLENDSECSNKKDLLMEECALNYLK